MKLSHKIRNLLVIQNKVEAAQFYLSGLEWLATELECPSVLPKGLDQKMNRAREALERCADSCKCPIGVADRAIREEFGTAFPDEFYELERRWQSVSGRLYDAVYGMKPVA